MKHKLSKQDNFIFLLIGLIFLLLGTALVDQLSYGHGQHIIMGITVGSLLLGVWSIQRNQAWFHSGLWLVAMVTVVSALSWFLDFAELHIIHLLLLLAFFVMTAKQASAQVLFSGAIDTNKVIGSICLFLLLGLIWAMLYLLIFTLIPQAFNGLGAGTGWSDLIYYSFVTLTTLGYGDISPAAPLARFLAYMEAATGLFYMAIVVASLVGSRIGQSSHSTM